MTSRSKETSPSEGSGKKGPAAPGSGAADPLFVVNGWTLLMHPCFLEQVEKLATAVEAERAKSGRGVLDSANAKLLRRIVEIAFAEVPEGPAHKDFRQGKTLGAKRTHWFRVKFGGGRFRLFFRFSTTEKIIIYAWVNDENSLRTYGSQTDAYQEFGRRLDNGRPPDGWKDLKAGAGEAETKSRMERLAARIGRKKG
jgi:toxin YhaV